MNREEPIVFMDRNDAGQKLGNRLRMLDLESPVLLAIPRGGIPIAVAAALALDSAEVGVIVARKLGAPGNPELGIGAVTANGAFVLDQELIRAIGATDQYIEEELRRQRVEALRHESQFEGYRSPPVGGRTVVVIDDGIATGATAVAAIRAIRAAGARRIVFAVPVGPRDTIELVRSEADDVVCLCEPENFLSVSQYYRDFRPVRANDARRMLLGARVVPSRVAGCVCNEKRRREIPGITARISGPELI